MFSGKVFIFLEANFSLVNNSFIIYLIKFNDNNPELFKSHKSQVKSKSRLFFFFQKYTGCQKKVLTWTFFLGLLNNSGPEPQRNMQLNIPTRKPRI
ncbi:hypothetical protein BpHYR1_021937 [Brachionus plicatilis]|uniref:Uncharacterized protein n=1 Tax=Brachionus plicatilis TaxID=10195 RepID=A0A3M7RS43_BRAPC|nr:hypothetical protein BpHYR1_021937 [Brachionus plicatilis]